MSCTLNGCASLAAGVDYNNDNNKIMFMFALSRNKFLFCFYYTAGFLLFLLLCVLVPPCSTIILAGDAWMRQMRRCVPSAHIRVLCRVRTKTNDSGNELFSQWFRVSTEMLNSFTSLLIYVQS